MLIETGFAQFSQWEFAECEHLSAWIDRVAELGDDQRVEGIRKLAGALSIADTEGMEAFHSGLPEAEREMAAIAFIRVSGNRDVAIAWPWLDRIEASQRSALVSEHLTHIAAKDRVLAKHWLDQAPITPAERDAIIRNLSLDR